MTLVVTSGPKELDVAEIMSVLNKVIVQWAKSAR